MKNQYTLFSFNNIDHLSEYNVDDHGKITIGTLADFSINLNIYTEEFEKLIDDNKLIFEEITRQTTPDDLIKFFEKIEHDQIDQDDWGFLIEFFPDDTHKKIFLNHVQPTRDILKACGPDLILEANINPHRFIYKLVIFPENCQTNELIDQYIENLDAPNADYEYMNPFMLFNNLYYVFSCLIDKKVDTEIIRGFLNSYDNICGQSNSSNSLLLYFKNELEEADEEAASA